MTKHGGKKVFVETTGRNSGKKCGKDVRRKNSIQARLM